MTLFGAEKWPPLSPASSPGLLALVAPGCTAVVTGDGPAKRATWKRVRVSASHSWPWISARPHLLRQDPRERPQRKQDPLPKAKGAAGPGLGAGVGGGPRPGLAAEPGRVEAQRGRSRTEDRQTHPRQGLSWILTDTQHAPLHARAHTHHPPQGRTGRLGAQPPTPAPWAGPSPGPEAGAK